MVVSCGFGFIGSFVIYQLGLWLAKRHITWDFFANGLVILVWIINFVFISEQQ